MYDGDCGDGTESNSILLQGNKVIFDLLNFYWLLLSTQLIICRNDITYTLKPHLFSYNELVDTYIM